MASAASKQTKKGRSIEDTLVSLNIDTDLSPEEAAQEAASATTEGVYDGSDGEEDGEDTSTVNVEAVVVPAPFVPPEEEEEEEEPFVPEPVTALPDPGPALVPPPPSPRAKQVPRSPGVGKMGKGIADKVPGAEKVKVYKRINGQKHFVNDYTKADLEQFPDFESFLVRYVKPEHGPGEYDLVGVDAHNREMQLGQVRLIAAPSDNNKDAGALHLVETMLQQQKDRDEQWLSRMRESMTPQQQQDPLQLLTGVMALQDKMTGKAGADSGGAMTAMMESMGNASSQSMQMFMAMMQQQQAAADRQNQLMMSLLARPREEDPITKLLLMKMMEDKSDSSGALPPPPPPPPSPTAGLAEILTAMAGFMGAVGGSGDGEDEFKGFLQQMLLKQQSDGLSTKDMIQLILKKDEQPGTDDFRRSIDNMAAIMNVSKNMSSGQEGGPSAGLWDALAALFSNRDFAGSIANTLRARTDQGTSQDQIQIHAERQRIEAERQRLAMEARLLQRAQLAAGTQLSAVPPSVQQQPQPQMALSPANHQGPSFNPAAQQQRAEKMAAARGIPQLPANTHEHINRLVMAKDDPDLVQKTVEMFIYFAEFEDWREFMEQLLGFIRNGNKGGALQYLGAFFEGLAAINMVDTQLGRRIVKLIDTHFDAIRGQMSDIHLDGDNEVTADDLLSGEGDDDDSTENDGDLTGIDGGDGEAGD
jgi:hypothetical protein